MRIFRFDQEVSRPVSEFGSRFRMGPLTGRESQVWVQIMHLTPGGLVGRHRAAARQLIAVVAGSGWATGAEGGRRDLKAGYAALWEPGEEHEAGSESGLTAVSIEGDFEVWAMGVTSEIVVSAYNSAWPEWFEQVRSHVWPAVKEEALRVDHIGSTAVPGLAAKPIIDMDVVVASEKEVRPAIERLEAAGYRWRGDLGVPGREAFKQVRDHGLPPHHLYLVVEQQGPPGSLAPAGPLACRSRGQGSLCRSQAAERGAGSQRHGGLRRRQGRIGCRTADAGQG